MGLTGSRGNMSIRVIEISRGEKPKGNCLIFGCTIASDFYVISEGTVERDSYYGGGVDDFINKMQKVLKLKDFSFSTDHVKFQEKMRFLTLGEA